MNEIESLKKELQETKLMVSLLMEMNQFKGGFLARSAHELRAPLSSLIALHQMILEGLCESYDEEKEFIAHGNNYVFKFLDLLNQLINISQLEIGQFPVKLQVISVNQLLHKVENLVKIYAKNEGLKLEFHFLDQDLKIKADQNLIPQTLVMIINSIIAVVEEGKIIVSPSILKPDQKLIINLDFPHSLKLLTEEINLLNTPLEKPLEKNYQRIKDHILNGNNLSFSPSQNLMMAQTLLEQMGGNLKLNIPPNLDKQNQIQHNTIQLQCWFPLVFDE